MTLKKNTLRPDNPCPCGSGRKRERCCSGKQDGGVARRHITARRLLIAPTVGVLAVWGFVGALLAAPVMSAPGKEMLAKQGRPTIPLLVVFDKGGQPILKSDFYTAEQLDRSIEQALGIRK